ncbi:transposase family protein [Rubellimicrobium aerolatum]|uniref:Transposase family protein n=1 Tax=Rubellimicrobium aerolatum TaxID=490979 RepID=A0ABW0SHU1_9RHOB
MGILLSGGRRVPTGLTVQGIEMVREAVIVHARSSRPSNRCPHCETPSNHPHGQYRRRLMDLPAHGRRVRIDLTFRRFRRDGQGCCGRTFSEALSPDLARLRADGRRGFRASCGTSGLLWVGVLRCGPSPRASRRRAAGARRGRA